MQHPCIVSVLVYIMSMNEGGGQVVLGGHSVNQVLRLKVVNHVLRSIELSVVHAKLGSIMDRTPALSRSSHGL